MKTLVDEAVKELKVKEEKEGAFELKMGEVPGFEELYRKDADSEDVALPRVEVDFDGMGLIAHSSGMSGSCLFRNFDCERQIGSTSFPKPRILTQKNLIQWSLHACKHFLQCSGLQGVLIYILNKIMAKLIIAERLSVYTHYQCFVSTTLLRIIYI